MEKKAKINDSFRVEIKGKIYLLSADELQRLQMKGIPYIYVIA